MKRKLPFALLFALLLSVVTQAQINIPQTSGFKGYAILLPGYINAQTNQIAEGAPAFGPTSNEQITSIFNSPASVGAPAMAVGGEINYTWAKSRTQVFLGNRLEDLLRLDVVFGAGLRQELKDSSIIAISGLFTPTILKAWSDPYIEGVDREKTSLNFPGFRVRWGRMFKTELELTATVRFYSFGEELSGEWLVSQSRLLQQDMSELDRNGIVYRIQGLYILKFGKHQILPAFRYSIDNHNGPAVANSGYLAKVTYLYLTRRFILDINAGFAQTKANAVNPIYDQTMQANKILLGASAFIPIKKFKSSLLNIIIFSEYYREDANIDFYDSGLGMIGLGLVWRTLKQ